MTNDNTAKAYTLRNLTADDIFPMFKIISKIGIREFRACFDSPSVKSAMAQASKEKESGEDAMNAIGLAVAFDVGGLIVDNLPKCRDDLYQLLSQLSGLQKQEIAELPLPTFAEMIIEVIRKDEFKDFFQVVSKLFK
ncbi:MAG: hypothetical protein ACI3XQ_07015 [Eubacteriales bacterium]